MHETEVNRGQWVRPFVFEFSHFLLAILETVSTSIGFSFIVFCVWVLVHSILEIIQSSHSLLARTKQIE